MKHYKNIDERKLICGKFKHTKFHKYLKAEKF